MPQTTGAMSGVNCVIELSDGAGGWDDISGSANQVGAPDQRRASGEGYTFDGDTAVVTGGKREPVEVTFRILYTEDAGEAWEKLRVLHETDGGAPVSIQWQPEADANTFTINNGILTRFTYPGGDATDAAPLQVEFAVRAGRIEVA